MSMPAKRPRVATEARVMCAPLAAAASIRELKSIHLPRRGKMRTVPGPNRDQGGPEHLRKMISKEILFLECSPIIFLKIICSTHSAPPPVPADWRCDAIRECTASGQSSSRATSRGP